MTVEQHDDLIIELSFYSPSQIHMMVIEYHQCPNKGDYQYPFYEFLKEKLEIEGYWKKVGLA
ncbi:MAG: hypothetical protein KJ630_13805 [Proteobacteria bacterium]|nr:hypothetical protein [Pseudomonadota bacterium]